MIHKNDIGSSRWICTRILISWLIWSIIGTLLKYVLFGPFFKQNNSLQAVFVFLVILIEWIIIVVTWKKFPKLNDNFYIRKELKYILIFVIILIIFEAILQIFSFIFNMDLQAYIASGKFMQTTFCLGLFYIAVWNVIISNNDNKIKSVQLQIFQCCRTVDIESKNENKDCSGGGGSGGGSISTASKIKLSNPNSNSKKNSHTDNCKRKGSEIKCRRHLSDIVHDKDCYELFMTFLVRCV